MHTFSLRADQTVLAAANCRCAPAQLCCSVSAPLRAKLSEGTVDQREAGGKGPS